MSEQALDVRRFLQIVRRHRAIVGIVALLGLLAGGGYAVLNPPMLASSALVVLPPATRDVATQAVIASSDPVLSGALRNVRPAMSLQALRSHVQVKSLTSNIISISAQGKTAVQAEGTANAVAASYVAYLSTANSVAQGVQARLLESATNATGTPLPVDLLVTGGLGALLGGLIGAIGVLALARGDRRLWERDAMANAIGVPVLASISVDHPADARRWTRLLEDYQPSAVHAWQLRTALRYLGQADVASAPVSIGDGVSVAVLSLSSDRWALALGPQLAVFAASLGIPTALVVGPQQDANAAATLRLACVPSPSPSPRRSSQLRVAVAGPDDLAWRQPGAKLTVIVAVVDGRAPRVADTMRASATVLGVSAGAATAAQLVGVAVSAAADGRQIDGILVADPDRADRTTGRVPQPARPAQRRMPTRLADMPTRLADMPTRVSGMPTEKRTTETDAVGFVVAGDGEPAKSGGAGEPAVSLPAAPADSVPLGVPVTVAQAGHRVARWWPGVVAAGTLVVLAVAVAAVDGALPLPGHAASPPRAAARLTAGDTRDRAATWIAQQVSRSAIMACDPAMCAVLQAQGIAAANLIELGPGDASDPLGTDIVVATAAVRSEFGSRLSGVYAPLVVASFGSGSAAIQIRVTAPDGSAAYLRELHSDLLARRAAGAQLLHNTHLTAAPAARQALADGDVDARLLIVIGALARSRHIMIASFDDSQPGASNAVPLRSADIAIAPGIGPGDGSPGSLLAFLRAQEPPYLPASATKTRLADGQPAIRVQFGDPSPLGLLASTGATPETANP